MLSRPPLVSVGLPVRNGQRYLADALESLLAQTMGDCEVIVSDNASTDDTEAIVRAFAGRDPRVRYVRNAADIGALPNFNQVFRMARGMYFRWHAYDDLVAPTFLERLVPVLDAEPDTVLAYSGCLLMDEHGLPARRDFQRGGYLTPDGRFASYDGGLDRDLGDDPVARYRAVMRSNAIHAPIHGLFRREALERTSLHVFHGSDNLLVAEAALLGRFRYVDEPLFSFRVHPASTIYLTREQWAARERGDARPEPPLALVRTFLNYVRAVGRADLTPWQKARAQGANLAYAARPHVLRNLLWPGLNNYFGWTRWPWARAPESWSVSHSPSSSAR